MNEHQDEKQKTAEKYKLFYWPGIPGRGEPIRLAFEEAGANYDDVAYTQGVKAVTSMMASPGGANLPNFAPPMLQHGDLVISQLPNIMLYIGPHLKLTPVSEEGRLRVNQLFLTLCDFQDEAHDTHHPIAVKDYYEDQKDVAKVKAADFRATRMPKFLGYFEKVLESGDGEWFLGDQITYADLMLFHVVDGLQFAFPRRMAKLSPQFPRVMEIHKRVRSRPQIAAYFNSERRCQFSKGIFRKYDELDGDE